MKIRILSLVACAVALAFNAGCQSTTTPGGAPAPTALQQIKAQLTPNVVAKGAQDAIAAVGAAVLANNPKYNADFVAAADALTALASQDPTGVTAGDFNAVLALTNLSASDQKAISAGLVLAIGTYEADFKLNFPQLKPNYVLFLDAAANGLFIASGNGTKVVPLPVVTVPAPVVAPTPAPAG
jgi:hypothetical protein